MVLGITGHRPHKLGGYNDATNRSKAIKAKMKDIFLEVKPACVVSGMALGIDQWAAEVALDLGIKVLALIPCKGQECKWPLPSQKQYTELLERIIAAGGSVEYVSNEFYTPQCMHDRNQKIVDYSDKILAIWDGSWGGTGSCVRVAQKAKKTVIKIHPSTLVVEYVG